MPWIEDSRPAVYFPVQMQTSSLLSSPRFFSRLHKLTDGKLTMVSFSSLSSFFSFLLSSPPRSFFFLLGPLFFSSHGQDVSNTESIGGMHALLSLAPSPSSSSLPFIFPLAYLGSTSCLPGTWFLFSCSLDSSFIFHRFLALINLTNAHVREYTHEVGEG